MGRLAFLKTVTQVLVGSFLNSKCKSFAFCYRTKVQGSDCTGILVIVLMKFLESEDKGFHYHSPGVVLKSPWGGKHLH